MFDLSVIIFVLALVGIIVMMTAQFRRMKASGDMAREFPKKDLSQENFRLLEKRARHLWLTVSHGTVIIATRAWVRLTHFVSKFFRRGFRKIEERMKKIEKKNATGESRGQSLFLTTIKTYKHEIKKLNGRVEEELPRPREEAPVIDTSAEAASIEESKPE